MEYSALVKSSNVLVCEDCGSRNKVNKVRSPDNTRVVRIVCSSCLRKS